MKTILLYSPHDGQLRTVETEKNVKLGDGYLLEDMELYYTIIGVDL